jgi:hypothetical protein
LFLNVRDPIREADARLTPTVVLVLGIGRRENRIVVA